MLLLLKVPTIQRSDGSVEGISMEVKEKGGNG